jgi:hypothetical protein
MRRPRARILASMLAAAAVLVGAIAAWAAGSDASVVVTAYQASDTVTSAVANCPSGSRAVGGGLASTAPAQSGVVQGEQRFSWPLTENGTQTFIDGGVARSWEAGLGFGLARGEWKVYALCSASSDATIQVETKNVGADTIAELQVACPSGSRVLGGGVSQPNASVKDNNAVGSSAPYDDTNSVLSAEDGDQARFWHAKYSNDTQQSQGVRVYALCSPTSDATLEVTRATAPPNTAAPTATAMCPAGRHVTGGGFATTVGFGTVHNSAPVDAAGSSAALSNGDRARGWTASTGATGQTSSEFRVLAICESDSASPSPTVTATPGPSGPTGPTGGVTQQLALSVRPRSVRAGKRKTFKFLVTSGGAPVEAATVTVRGRQAATTADGRSTITRKFASRGTATVTVTKSGFNSATATIKIRKRR